MDLHTLFDSFTLEKMMKIFEQYRSFGPLLGIGLPMLEAFLPFLPLVVFIVANVNSFGFGLGFLLSWLGASAGAFIVFLLVRKFGQERFFHFLSRHKGISRMVSWVEEKGFGPLFILLCFPFTPSAAVNVVAGLSRISIWNFMLAVFTGKLVMIFIVSYVGQDLHALITDPMKSITAGAVLLVMWIIGKILEKRLNAKMGRKLDKR
ncbi:TVP38/TMEM64 family protein [Metabacillus sp. KIGAM252]|uniref:TVP38/TMEM64 family membrane protein n=1 Tax=Metabacillus flavus TaxID=2823519 RepID=A0ABS5LCD7_9BACI|nr:TVP38/TMEM64 family protein [Metabacillus flavus]MBS2968294.1 TVP38/TMEM64 family protein [Metabacillus flavus]